MRRSMSVVNAKKTSARTIARMNFRINAEIKARVARAAAITGQELTDFAVSTLNEKATAIIERYDTITLDRDDYEFFLKALDKKAQKPSKRALSAARRYRQGRRKGARHILDN